MLAKAPRPEPRFHISTLEIEEEHVFLITMAGQEVVGHMLLTNTGKQRFERWQGGRRYERIEPHYVSMWRPLDLTRWPFQLPEPALVTPQQRKPVAGPTLREELDLERPWWERPLIYLGRPSEAPGSVDEVEARLLRCLRTRNQLDRETYRTEVLWPKPWQDEIKAIQTEYESKKEAIKKKNWDVDPEMRGWRPEDHDDYFADGELRAKPVRFEPTPRDVSDYEANIDKAWLAHVWKRDRHLFHARAALPPIQWWRLADQERVDESVVKDRYREGLKRIFERVRG